MKIFAIVLFAAVAVAGSSANNEVCFKSLSKVCGNDIETGTLEIYKNFVGNNNKTCGNNNNSTSQ